MDMLQAILPAAPAVVRYTETAAPLDGPIDILARADAYCKPLANDDVVVCGRRDTEEFRLRPLPPLPEADGLLSRPLRVQIAPGVSIGFQDGGGFGLKVKFGPGKKSDDRVAE